MNNLSNKATLMKTVLVSLWVGAVALTFSAQATADEASVDDAVNHTLATQHIQVGKDLKAQLNNAIESNVKSFEIDITMDLVKQVSDFDSEILISQQNYVSTTKPAK